MANEANMIVGEAAGSMSSSVSPLRQVQAAHFGEGYRTTKTPMRGAKAVIPLNKDAIVI